MHSMLQFESESFSSWQEGDLGMLELRGDLFGIATDLDAKERLFSLLGQVEKAPDIKILLVVNAPGALDEKGYERFLRALFTEEPVGDAQAFTSDLEKEQLLSREEYGISQLIMRLHHFEKITAIGLQGNIAPPFLGMALAFDCRLAAEDVVFSLSFSRFGVPPSGGLGFFLPRFIGQGKAMELVLSSRPLLVREASSLGLVNAVLPNSDFTGQCVSALSALIDLPLDIAGYTKKLLFPYPEEELALYLEKECEIMRSAWRRHALQLHGNG